jgi:triosephosphate isomerase
MTEIKIPLILVNFKAYPGTIGEEAIEKAKIAEEISQETNVCIGIAPQFVDIARVADSVSIPVIAQHIDLIDFGRHTGYILPESVKKAGAIGTLISHTERKLTDDVIRLTIGRARQVGLSSIVCCDMRSSCARLARMFPEMIAFEPPELIGTGISVSKAKPQALAQAIRLVKRVNPDVIMLCGAGITTGDDVSTSLELGAEGVLVGSVAKDGGFYRRLREMAKAMTE